MQAGASEFVRDVLGEYGAVTRPGMDRYLCNREPHRHLYNLVSDYPTRGGRMLRSSLCIASAKAFGASMDEVVNTAVSLELMHNAFLVHDDVEDEGQERRGKPTMNVLHGVPVAVNVGDALAVVSLQPLIDNTGILGPRLSLRVLEESARMARESVEGQAVELGWRGDNVMELADDDYLSMILKKTCWYTTIHPCRVGALIGTRDGIELERFVSFGFFLGAAFQIQDDLLNLIGDRVRYGKEIDGDVLEGKRTLMLIHLLRSAAPEDRARLARVLSLSRGERTVEHVRWIRDLMDIHGSIEHARQVAHGLAGAAMHEFEAAYADVRPSRDTDFIQALTRWMLERT